MVDPVTGREMTDATAASSTPCPWALRHDGLPEVGLALTGPGLGTTRLRRQQPRAQADPGRRHRRVAPAPQRDQQLQDEQGRGGGADDFRNRVAPKPNQFTMSIPAWDLEEPPPPVQPARLQVRPGGGPDPGPAGARADPAVPPQEHGQARRLHRQRHQRHRQAARPAEVQRQRGERGHPTAPPTPAATRSTSRRSTGAGHRPRSSGRRRSTPWSWTTRPSTPAVPALVPDRPGPPADLGQGVETRSTRSDGLESRGHGREEEAARRRSVASPGAGRRARLPPLAARRRRGGAGARAPGGDSHPASLGGGEARRAGPR